MDTQNTPIHIKLWHRDFWLMMLATLSLSMGVYMQIPSLAAHMRDSGYESWQVGVVIGIMGLGLFFSVLCVAIGWNDIVDAVYVLMPCWGLWHVWPSSIKLS